MGSILTLFNKLGDGIVGLIGSTNALYSLYFIAFFFGIYTAIKFALDLTHFQGKPAKVISFMFTVITTGAIFYGTGTKARTAPELLQLFHGWGGFLFILIFAIGFIGFGVFMFNKNKEKNKTFALLTLFLGIFIACGLLLPQFYDSKTINTDNILNEELTPKLFTGEPINSFLATLGTIVLWTFQISFLLTLWFLGVFILEKLEDGSGTKSSSSSKTNKANAKKQKDIGDIKNILKLILNEIQETNTHFQNKNNLLKQLRTQVNNLKSNTTVVNAGGNNGGNP